MLMNVSDYINIPLLFNWKDNIVEPTEKKIMGVNLKYVVQLKGETSQLERKLLYDRK